MQMLWKRISDRPNWRHVYKVRRLRLPPAAPGMQHR